MRVRVAMIIIPTESEWNSSSVSVIQNKDGASISNC